MTDRGPTYLNVIDSAPEHRPAILTVLAEHFDGKIEGDEVVVNVFGGSVAISIAEDGTVICDDYLDNQDNYGNAEALLDALIAAGATGVNFGLRLYDGVYTFRSRGNEKRVDVTDDDGEFYVTQDVIQGWLAEDGITLDGLRAKLDEHFGRDWP